MTDHWVDRLQSEGWVVDEAEAIKEGGLVAGQQRLEAELPEGELVSPLEFSAKDVVKFVMQKLRDEEERYRRQCLTDRQRKRRVVRIVTLKYRARKRRR